MLPNVFPGELTIRELSVNSKKFLSLCLVLLFILISRPQTRATDFFQRPPTVATIFIPVEGTLSARPQIA